MGDQHKTKTQLMAELETLRQEVAALKDGELALKRTEESLQESNRRIVNILESMTDAFYTLDRQWRFTYLNRRAEQFLRRTREELLGKDAWEEFPEALTAVTHQMFHRAVTSQVAVDFEVFHSPLETWVEVHACPFPEGLSVYFHDITERKRAEEEKRRLQLQLFQIQKLEALGTLAGGIAHDFNNLLSVIIGFTELATDEVPTDGMARRNLEEVSRASRRAKALVQQLLTFSRAGAPERSRVSLQLLVEETLRFLRASLPPTLQLSTHMDDTIEVVWGNASQLQQVVLNLCLNAAQAMEGQNGRLEVSLLRVAVEGTPSETLPSFPPGVYAELCIRDTGCGMTSEVQARIFEPFFTTKAIGEGSGLGLAVVHGIVTSHGGAIRVESQPGVGTTFQVYLPLAEHAVSTDTSFAEMLF